jgi:acetylornithine deacetylase/succinyl-diaminopimelate desuccinylase-like protein
VETRKQVLEWLRESDYLNELKSYLSLPSRSRNAEEVKKSAAFSLELLKKIGLISRIYETIGNPLIYGESLVNKDAPSILIYGHHDVQPEGNLEEWNTPPFEPTLIGDKLYGRGSADNKGQHYAHILAIRFLRENYPEVFKKLNIKFILDGDEELGSYSLPDFVKDNVELLDADFVYVSDGPSLLKDTPTIVGAVRGIVSFQIKIKHNPTDLHSGNFGGVARSATMDLIKLLNSMIDNQGKVLVQGFYDDVEQPTDKEQMALKQLEPVYDSIIAERTLTPAIRPDRYSHAFLNEKWPTLNINGIMAGGVKDQRRTIIPSEAYASVDCRLVAKQDPNKIENTLKSHILTWSRDNNIKQAVDVEFEHAMAPITSSLNEPVIGSVEKAAEIGFKKKPLLVPSLGGSLPIQLFSKYLEKPVILVPYALPDENNHAPNENLDIPFFESGVVTTVSLLLNLAGMQ